MERLTIRLKDQCGNPTDEIILSPYMRYQDDDTKKIILNRLAYYEDMEEQGRLVIYDEETVLAMAKANAKVEEDKLELLRIINKLANQQSTVRVNI